MVSPGHILEVQFLRPHQRPTESKTLGWGPIICILTNPPGDLDAYSNLGILVLVHKYWSWKDLSLNLILPYTSWVTSSMSLHPSCKMGTMFISCSSQVVLRVLSEIL